MENVVLVVLVMSPMLVAILFILGLIVRDLLRKKD